MFSLELKKKNGLPADGRFDVNGVTDEAVMVVLVEEEVVEEQEGVYILGWTCRRSWSISAASSAKRRFSSSLASVVISVLRVLGSDSSRSRSLRSTQLRMLSVAPPSLSKNAL